MFLNLFWYVKIKIYTSLYVLSTSIFWQSFIDPLRSSLCPQSRASGSAVEKQERDVMKEECLLSANSIVSGWEHLYCKVCNEWFPAEKTEQLLLSWLVLQSHWFHRSKATTWSFIVINGQDVYVTNLVAGDGTTWTVSVTYHVCSPAGRENEWVPFLNLRAKLSCFPQ